MIENIEKSNMDPSNKLLSILLIIHKNTLFKSLVFNLIHWHINFSPSKYTCTWKLSMHFYTNIWKLFQHFTVFKPNKMTIMYRNKMSRKSVAQKVLKIKMYCVDKNVKEETVWIFKQNIDFWWYKLILIITRFLCFIKQLSWAFLMV